MPDTDDGASALGPGSRSGSGIPLRTTALGKTLDESAFADRWSHAGAAVSPELALTPSPASAQEVDLRSAAHLSHRPVRRLRHSDRQRHARLSRHAQRARRRHRRRQARLIEECETGYDTKKGVECYESVKGKNPVVVNPYSTGITLQLIPKAAVDKIPILSMAYGLSASAVGNVFPWIFNPPATYWDGASAFIQLRRRQGRRPRQAQGQDDRPHLSRRAATARSRSRCSSSSPRTTASTLKLYPVPPPDMQNQSSHLARTSAATGRTGSIMQGWGAMNPTAVKEAAKINFPMDKLVGVWWSGGDDDARGRRRRRKGYRRSTSTRVGTNFPAIQDIEKHVVDKGKSKPREGQGRREPLQPRRLNSC